VGENRIPPAAADAPAGRGDERPAEPPPGRDRAGSGARWTKLYLTLAGGVGFVVLWFFFRNFTTMKVATAVFGALGAAVFVTATGLEAASLVAALRARVARRGGRLLDAARHEEFAWAAAPRAGRAERARAAQEAARMSTHAVFADHSGSVTALAFAPSGAFFATGSEDGRVVVRCVDHGGEVRSADFDSPVTALAARPDGKALAIGTEAGLVHMLGLEDGAVEVALEQGFTILALGFAPDDRLVTASTASGAIYLPRGEAKPMAGLDAGGEEVTAATFDSRAERFVAGTSSGSVTAWDVRGKPTGLARLMQGGPVRSAALSPDGRLLVTCGDARPFLWQVDPFRRIGALSTDEDVFGVAFTPGADAVLACTRSAVLCFSTHRMAGLRAFVMDAHRFLVAGMSPDRSAVAAGTADGKVGIWRLAGA